MNSSTSLSKPAATFLFGEHLEHECQVICDYLGNEKYYVDGILVHKRWNLWISGFREFTAIGHRLKIEISINTKRVNAKAFVDERLVADDLFSDYNTKLIDMRGNMQKSPPHILVKVIIWALLAFILIVAFNTLGTIF